MKKIYVSLIAVLSVCQFSYAQWTTNSASTVTSTPNSVGIGTNAPTALLSIFAPTTGFNFNIYTPAVNAGDLNGIKFYNGYGIYENKWAGISSVAESLYSNSTGLALYSQSTERLRISGTGNVGIGTATPQQRLDLNGGSIAMGDLNSTGVITFRNDIPVGSAGSVGIAAIDAAGNGNNDGLGLYCF
jgi:hypothetical protein